MGRTDIEERLADAPVIKGVPTGITGFLGATRNGPLNKAVRVSSFAEYEQRFGGLVAGLELGYAIRQFFLNGGTSGWVVRIPRRAPAARILRALQAFDEVDLINLITLPGITAAEAVSAALDYCRKRRAILIVDPPASVSTPAAIEELVREGGFPRSSNAALYFPWVIISDALSNSEPRSLPPSGTIAGLIARSDRTGGVWKAPAGKDATLHDVQALTHALTDPETRTLNALGVNCLRSFSGAKPVAWGARMMGSNDNAPPEQKFLPIARLSLFVEESLHRGMGWVAFEPNDDRLWSRLRGTVEDFLHALYQQGAFVGRTPAEAYYVKCDRTTTSAADIERGVVNVLVGFAALKPAEFIMLRVRRQTG